MLQNGRVVAGAAARVVRAGVTGGAVAAVGAGVSGGVRTAVGAGVRGGAWAAVLSLLLLVPAARSAVLDRIAVSVGSQVITVRDLEREIRVAAFLDGTKPDLSAANKRAMAERLVDQTLIRQEMMTSHFPFPTVAAVTSELEKLKKTSFPTDADYRRALEAYGITEQDVLDVLLRMGTLEGFINLRFRPGVQVSDQEIEDYFNRVVAPAARAAHPGEPVELEEYRAQIEEKLTGQQADQETENWLKEARRRTEIVFHPEAFE